MWWSSASTIRKDISSLQRDGRAELRAALRTRQDRQGPSDGLDAVTHQREAEAEAVALLRRGFDVEADAVIGNRTQNSRCIADQSDRHLRRSRVLGDVRETFLHQAIEDYFDRPRTG